jgi:hypothetical protein
MNFDEFIRNLLWIVFFIILSGAVYLLFKRLGI